jgi:hypothetical protein
MAAIVATLINVFSRLYDFLRLLWGLLAGFFVAVWDAFILLVQPFINILVQITVFLVKFTADVLLFILTLAVSILPVMPDTPAGSTDFSMLGQANRYLPISEVAALALVWSTIFGAIAAYKLAKFVRGAG